MGKNKITESPETPKEEGEVSMNSAQKVLNTVTGMVRSVRHRNTQTQNTESNHEILLQKEMEFHQAAKKNDVPTMTKLKEQKVNINARNNLNRTALHFAVAGNHIQAVSFLLGHKARVDMTDKHGLSVLHLAAWSADLTVFQMLIKAGANQKSTNEDGMNILHFAAENNKNDIVDYLLKELQLNDLNVEDEKGRKPFHLAAKSGHVQMINNLLSFQLFTSEKDKEGNTALHLAASNGHNDVVEVLINLWENIDDPNENSATPFYLAVEGGHEVCADLLLKAGSDINIRTKDDYSALHIAAQNGHKNLIHFLLARNVDLAPKLNTITVIYPEGGITILSLQKAEIKTSYSLHATTYDIHSWPSGHIPYEDATERLKDKNPPLHLAILNNQMEIVDVLLEGGYDINAINTRQQTPLHLAAELKITDLVEKLLRAGCDLRMADKKGKTALGVAARSNHTLIVDMIIKAERYYEWKKVIKDINQEEHEDVCLTFKQDHSSKTSQLRSAMWKLAYNEFKPHEWKKLAQFWKFTEPQIKAIEQQWTGKTSYKEHGHRMLLIWLHGVLLTEQNPIKSLYEDLVETGHHQLAENVRMQSTNSVEPKKCIIS